MYNRIVQIGLVVSLLCLSSSLAFAQGKKWALLIGIEEYDRVEISQLKYAEKDVNAIARSLQNLGYEPANIRIMTSAIKNPNDPNRPTNDNVSVMLDRLAKNIKPEDTFLFYFTGHGFSKANADTKQNENFLASVNTNPATINSLRSSAISLANLQNAMKDFKAKQILFVIDACRNDPEAAKGDADNKLTDDFSKSLVVASRAAQAGISGVLFACSNGERAFEDANKEQSVFTYYLLEALSGKAGGKGPLVMADVVKYVQTQVGKWAGDHFKKQTPEFLPKEAGVLVLADKISMDADRLVDAQPVRDPKPLAGNRLAQTKINAKDGAEMILIPAGPFLMGSTELGLNALLASDSHLKRDMWPPFAGEIGRHKVYMDEYYMYKTPVTVKQYKRFCAANGKQMPPAPSFNPNWSKEDHPIVRVTWDDAQAYCRWAGGSLPTEAQWEKAARGEDGRMFPWGNTFDSSCLQHSTNTPGDAGGTASVGSFPKGASPYGVLDMAGNVFSWCADWYDENYYLTSCASFQHFIQPFALECDKVKPKTGFSDS